MQWLSKMALAGSHEYEALTAPNDIRLLDILPGRVDEPLCISLRIANLDAQPEYEALSYVWGDPTITRGLRCNGHDVQVTTNLHDALTQLRLTARPRTLWADALCINQADLVEKAQQISIMHHIYRACRCCVVWLGSTDEHSDAALDLVQVIAELVGRKVGVTVECLDAYLKETGRSMTLSAEIGFSDRLPPKDSPKWVSLFSLMSRQWFSRIWVVQEAFFSPDLLFYCGPRTCHYSDLFYTSDWIMTNGAQVTYTLWLAGLTWHRQNRFNIMHMRQDAATQEKQQLADLLDNLTRFRATDLRDKVYALIHLPAFRREYPEIALDYHLSPEAIYVDLAFHILERSRDLLLLTMVTRDEESPEDQDADLSQIVRLPSWVPRWHASDNARTRNVSTSYYHLMSTSGTSERARAMHSVNLLAPADLPADIAGANMVTLSKTILSIRGFEFDVVHDVCEVEFWGHRLPDKPRIPLFRSRTGPWSPYQPRRAGSHQPSSPTMDVMPNANGFSPLLADSCPYLTEPEVVAAYTMTLTAGCRAYKGIFPIRCTTSTVNQHLSDFVAFLTWIRTLRRAANGETNTEYGHNVPPGDFYPPGLYAADRPTLTDTAADETADMSLRYSIMACHYSMDRCLYRTRRGYLASGPSDVQQGDVVCVFMGGAVPFILRPRCSGDGYTLVGDTYVHGIMDGELVQAWEEAGGRLELREFYVH